MQTQMNSERSLSDRKPMNRAMVLNISLGQSKSPFPELTTSFGDRVFSEASAAIEAKCPSLCEFPMPNNQNAEPE